MISMVYGIGRLGLMKDGSKPRTTDGYGKLTREYDLWKGVLKRCYSDKFHERYPTYKECTVCDRWLIFANFLDDLPLIEGYEMWRDNPKQRIAFDKDSKVEGNKIYSLETCCFISQSENSKERIERYSTLTQSRKKVMAISLTEKKVIVFQSIVQAEKLGFDHSAICKCCKGKQKTHKGYKWKYI